MNSSPPCLLITGANGGIGIAIARYFLTKDETCFVYLGVRSNRDQAEALVSEFSDRSATINLDVTCEEDWEKAMESIDKDDRKISVLVNNAGHHDDQLMAMMPREAWHGVIDANLNAAFTGSQAVLRGMMQLRFGRIINIASLSAIMAPMGQTNYAAAKAGMVAMTRSLAKEVARMGITVNAICPGYVQTQALGEMDAEKEKQIKKTIPMRRFGQPEEVANAVFFLANQESGYITGASLKIDGGIF